MEKVYFIINNLKSWEKDFKNTFKTQYVIISVHNFFNFTPRLFALFNCRRNLG